MNDPVRLLVTRLSALSGDEIVRKAAARALGSVSAEDGAKLLEGVMGLAREGSAPALAVLPALLRALQWERASIPHVEALQRVAAAKGLDDVEALFTEAEPVAEYELDAARRADSKLFSQSLGHLKEMARLTKDVDTLERLAVASEPTVVRNVLLNSRMTEPLVVRIAARRPARPEPLLEIWASKRWSIRPAVRKALVFNPYFPPQTGSKIVPLLGTADLKELSRDTVVHVSLRMQARLMLED